MRKLMLLLAGALLATGVPALAQQQTPQNYRPDIGGHARHGHRDWSQQENRHVHNVCWEWDASKGWVWVCR